MLRRLRRPQVADFSPHLRLERANMHCVVAAFVEWWWVMRWWQWCIFHIVWCITGYGSNGDGDAYYVAHLAIAGWCWKGSLHTLNCSVLGHRLVCSTETRGRQVCWQKQCIVKVKVWRWENGSRELKVSFTTQFQSNPSWREVTMGELLKWIPAKQTSTSKRGNGKHLLGPSWETISKEELSTSWRPRTRVFWGATVLLFLVETSCNCSLFSAFPLLLTLGCITGGACREEPRRRWADFSGNYRGRDLWDVVNGAKAPGAERFKWETSIQVSPLGIGINQFVAWPFEVYFLEVKLFRCHLFFKCLWMLLL